MTDKTKTTGAPEWAAFGAVAGLVFAATAMGGAAVMGNSALMPLRSFASVVLGDSAMQTSASLGVVVVVGILAHLALSAIFGLVYGLVSARFSTETEASWGRQAGQGLLYGAMIWAVNFQLVARLLYPWFLDTPQLLQMLMHAMFFGLPLALIYAAAERRLHHVHTAPTHA